MNGTLRTAANGKTVAGLLLLGSALAIRQSPGSSGNCKGLNLAIGYVDQEKTSLVGGMGNKNGNYRHCGRTKAYEDRGTANLHHTSKERHQRGQYEYHFHEPKHYIQHRTECRVTGLVSNKNQGRFLVCGPNCQRIVPRLICWTGRIAMRTSRQIGRGGLYLPATFTALDRDNCGIFGQLHLGDRFSRNKEASLQATFRAFDRIPSVFIFELDINRTMIAWACVEHIADVFPIDATLPLSCKQSFPDR